MDTDFVSCLKVDDSGEAPTELDRLEGLCRRDGAPAVRLRHDCLQPTGTIAQRESACFNVDKRNFDGVVSNTGSTPDGDAPPFCQFVNHFYRRPDDEQTSKTAGYDCDVDKNLLALLHGPPRGYNAKLQDILCTHGDGETGADLCLGRLREPTAGEIVGNAITGLFGGH